MGLSHYCLNTGTGRMVYLGRYLKNGGSMSVIIPPPVRQLLGLKPGDRMAMRVVDDLLVMQRVPLEAFARPTHLIPSLKPEVQP